MGEFEDKYEILNALGTQKVRKFGSTFLVKNKSTDELCVLKKVSKSAPKLTIDCLISEKGFEFQHKSLPQSLDFFETETDYLWVKNYVEGQELGEFWKAVKRRNRHAKSLEILNALASIFKELEEKKIVHCDIKPSNLIISEKEGKLNVALIDFGMAIQQDKLPNRGTLFSLAFASPELILNQLTVVSQQSDFYALGILLYQLHCDVLPFHNSHPALMTQLSITYPLPKHTRLSASHHLFLKKLCAKHQFTLPPNQMNADELKLTLSRARDERFMTISELNDAAQRVIPKKVWF